MSGDPCDDLSEFFAYVPGGSAGGSAAGAEPSAEPSTGNKYWSLFIERALGTTLGGDYGFSEADAPEADPASPVAADSDELVAPREDNITAPTDDPARVLAAIAAAARLEASRQPPPRPPPKRSVPQILQDLVSRQEELIDEASEFLQGPFDDDVREEVQSLLEAMRRNLHQRANQLDGIFERLRRISAAVVETLKPAYFEEVYDDYDG